MAIVLMCAVGASALAFAYMLSMPGRSWQGELPALGPEGALIRDRLEHHVSILGSREHNMSNIAELEKAAQYIETTLAALGYEVSRLRMEGHAHDIRNIEIQIGARSLAREIVVIGAHYDSVVGAPGANDNGSGVAALLELARLLKGFEPDRTLRLVWFVNEEPPFFKTTQMGSWAYAARAKAAGDEIVAMLSIETIGYYRDEPGTQHYPPPLHWFYPNTGNFIAFVGNIGSRGLVRQCVKAFRQGTRFPSEGAALPAVLPGVDWSDHWAFWHHGYRAIMITDTAPYRYPHYHTSADTPDKLDYDKTARVVTGLKSVIEELASKKAAR